MKERDICQDEVAMVKEIKFEVNELNGNRILILW